MIAGDHDYGGQLDGQLELTGLPRADDPEKADLIVLAGLANGPEIATAAAMPTLPVIAFDGVQGGELGAGREVHLALPIAPHGGIAVGDLHRGVEHSRRAAELVVAALRGGAGDRAAMLAQLRELGPFDEHGDPADPPVWLWRAHDDWTLEPVRPL